MSKLDRSIEIIERIREQKLVDIARDIIALEAKRDHLLEVFGMDTRHKTELFADIIELSDRCDKYRDALTEMLAYGVELDDPRVPYLTVQIGRETIEAARKLVEGV
jgi:hypothetical protein